MSSMGFKNFIGRVQKILNAITAGVSWVGAGALVLMVLIVVANVVGRYLFRKPVLGAVEMVGLLTVDYGFLRARFYGIERGPYRC